MSSMALKQRVEARDRLVALVENAGIELHEHALLALRNGDLRGAEAALDRNDGHLRTLAENLRIYQAELHAQADELAASQAHTEELLRQFSTLFTQMPVATLLVGPQGDVLEHNLAAERLFALRVRPMVRFLHRMVDPGDYQHRVRPALHEALAAGASALDGVGFVADDGRRFVGDLHLALLPPARGRAASLACAVIDRTEPLRQMQALRDAGEALRVSEAFLAETAQVGRIGGWDWLPETGTVRWSPVMRSLFGLAADAPAGLDPMLALAGGVSRLALTQALERAAHDGLAFELELDMAGPAGPPMRVRAVGHAEMADDGAVRRVMGVFQDMTGPYLAQQRIGELTERLNVATDAGGIGIWDWDLAAGRLYFDSRLCGLLGLTQAPPGDLHTALAGRLDGADAEGLRMALERALEKGEPLALELRLAGGPAGEPERWLHLTGRAHETAAGARASRLVGCAWDCSREHEAARLKTAKEAAESASRAKSAFLSRMSHELRTPLNAILGFAQLMRLETEAGNLLVKPHRVQLIETAARHLLDLINEVLDVSQIEAGKLVLRLQRLDVHELVAECLPLLQGAAAVSQVSMVDHTGDAPPLWVLGDRLRLKEVLINLLSNAVKYNRPGGRVDVSACIAGDHVRLTVADTGRGMDEQQLGNLYQPFNRLGAEALGVEGSGMGLFVSRRFMELMGGSIEARSRPGEGTAFDLRLNLPAR